MGAVLTSANRYRHIVFTATSPARALNVGSPDALNAWSALPTFSDCEASKSQIDEATFLAWVFRESGLCLRDYRRGSLTRRLPACLRTLRAPTVSQARRILQSNPKLLPIALDALLLGVTEFFRDASVFACLEGNLRHLAEQNRHTLRFWSAGCSTGAELYSVSAMLGDLGILARSELLGTDIRSDAIDRARAGAFTSTSPQHDSPMKPLPNSRIVWRRGNVLKDDEPGPWDVILCRNLAMYLQRSVAERLWSKLAAHLRPGGLLVVGKAEQPCESAGFARVGPCIYRRTES